MERAAHRHPGAAPRVAARLARSRTALWTAFALVHGWLAYVGLVLMPGRAFWDVDLYRWWASLALGGGPWPVLDTAWVYPAGALGPVLLPALTGARTTTGYAAGWCLMVTLLDAVAVAALLRAARGPHGARADHAAGRADRAVPAGAWWWTAFLVLLGPVAMGRLDAVVAPVTVLALLVAAPRPRLAAALLTAGAWVKVAPGALVLPLAAAVRRPVRDVVVPGAAVSAVVVGLVAVGGGLPRVAGFLTEQTRRDLQVESVAATGWVVRGLVDERVRIAFDEALVTWEVTGPGTEVAVAALGLVLPLALAALGVVLLHRTRRRGADPGAVLLWGALAVSALLVVANKVGSPQFVGWLAAPVAVALTTARGPRWVRVGVLVLALATLTQLLFPLGATGLVTGDPAVTAVLVVRNAGLVVLLAVAVREVLRSGAQRGRDAASRTGGDDLAGTVTRPGA